MREITRVGGLFVVDDQSSVMRRGNDQNLKSGLYLIQSNRICGNNVRIFDGIMFESNKLNNNTHLKHLQKTSKSNQTFFGFSSSALPSLAVVFSPLISLITDPRGEIFSVGHKKA